MKGNIFPRTRKGTEYSRNYMLDCLGSFNARKGICEVCFKSTISTWVCLVFDITWNWSLLKLCGRHAEYPKSLKTTGGNLKMGSMPLDTVGSHKALIVHICTSLHLSAGPLHAGTCPHLLVLWRCVHRSNSISKPESATFSLHT